MVGQMACFLSFATLKPSVERVHLEAAAVQLKGPGALKINEASDERIRAAYEALPKPFRDAVEQVAKMAAEGGIPIMEPLSTEPLSLKLAVESIQTFLVAKVICTSDLTLPPQSSSPWRWGERWQPVLMAGEVFGESFSRGLFRMSAEQSRAGLNIRGLLGGLRPVAIRAVTALCLVITSIDLRDNELSSEELSTLSDALTTTDAIEKLNLAGNLLNAHDLLSVFAKLAQRGSSKLAEVDASRTQLVDGDSSEQADAIKSLAKSITNGGELLSLSLAQSGLSDAASAGFVTAIVTPSSPKSKELKLMDLDLSRNGLGAAFAKAFSAVAKRFTKLTSLNLSHNNFGAEAGGVAIRAALAVGSLSSLDMSATNLCDCRPVYSSEGATRAYRTTAIEALFQALKRSSATEIMLHGNELCGIWQERICGEVVMRGEYSTAVIDLIASCLEEALGDGGKPLSLRKDSLQLAQGNFLRPVDAKRLADALSMNASKTSASKVGGSWLNKRRTGGGGGLLGGLKGNAAKPTEEKSNATPAADQIDGASTMEPVSADIADAAKPPSASSTAAGLENPVLQRTDSSGGASLLDHSVHDASFKQVSGKPSPQNSPRSPGAKGKSKAKKPGLKRSDTSATPLKPAGLKRSDTSPGMVAGDASDTRPLNVRLGSHLIKKKIKFAELMHDWDDDGGGTIDAKEFRTNLKKMGLMATDEECTDLFSKLDDDGSGELDLNEMKKALKAMVDAAKEAEDAERKAKEAEELAKRPKVAVPDKDKVYSSEKPVTQLMVAAITLHARKEVPNSSPLVQNHAVAAGSLLYIIEQQELASRVGGKPVVEQRMLIELDGDTQPLGWVTGISKDEVENIKLAAAGFPLFKVMRQLPVRDGKEAEAAKVGDVMAGTKLRVMQEFIAPDKCERVRIHATALSPHSKGTHYTACLLHPHLASHLLSCVLQSGPGEP